jgi:glycosyltransferase involved in cell wall biosynthesis
VKVGVVAQRYGQSVNGGAELHARYIAEHLARHATVEVLTTCAADYVTWRNELPPGVEQINGVAVRRFPVAHERDPLDFAKRSNDVFGKQHSIADELAWLESEGPACPALVKHITRTAGAFDFFIFFSYRYYQSFHGIRAASTRAILVPTAERDAAIGLEIFSPIFRGVRALMYNSHEERAMIQAVADNRDVPSVVVGIGSDVPQNPQPVRFRQKYNLRGPFAVYVGRLDENKGCRELFDFFEAYSKHTAGRLTLVLIGKSLLPIPENPRIRHLGFVDDVDKFDAMAAADMLIMPSYFESLSMVALEAWALGRPVLANGRCDVLKGQSMRSNAGLYYENESEFVEALRALEQHRWLSGSLGRNGRQFFRDNYAWPVIERKYLEMLERLSKGTSAAPIEPLPGWLGRRRASCSPAAAVLANVPGGPVMTAERIQTPQTENTPRPAEREQPVAQGPRHHSRRHPRSSFRRQGRPR